jgi:transposase
VVYPKRKGDVSECGLRDIVFWKRKKAGQSEGIIRDFIGRSGYKGGGKAGVRILFLPSYRPGFNPIEHVRAHMKSALRDLKPRFEKLESAVYHYFYYIYITS